MLSDIERCAQEVFWQRALQPMPLGHRRKTLPLLSSFPDGAKGSQGPSSARSASQEGFCLPVRCGTLGIAPGANVTAQFGLHSIFDGIRAARRGAAQILTFGEA